MSTAEPLPPTSPAPARPAPRLFGARGSVDPGRGRGLLSLVPPPVRARRAPFVALILTLLAVGLVGLLLLNTASAQDAFKLHALQSEQAELDMKQQVYASSDGDLDNPATLYRRAAALGLVPGGPPVFLKPGQPLPKGAIRLGNIAYIPAPIPVAPPPAPTPSAVTRPTPTPKPAKTPVAKKSAAVRKPVAGHPGVTRPRATVTPAAPRAKTTAPPRTPAATTTTAPHTATTGTR